MGIQSKVAVKGSVDVQEKPEQEDQRPPSVVNAILLLHDAHHPSFGHGGCGIGAEREI